MELKSRLQLPKTGRKTADPEEDNKWYSRPLEDQIVNGKQFNPPVEFGVAVLEKSIIIPPCGVYGLHNAITFNRVPVSTSDKDKQMLLSLMVQEEESYSANAWISKRLSIRSTARIFIYWNKA
ncbi:unnamed protein product [Nezara viridula]|uniref:Uncharacterized protein n=1 Tax=Nezara viridula TaxID=85310 RepID=A0A9P0HTF6_NEZVI|nr:unnamed protein product [Nezara viridula]